MTAKLSEAISLLMRHFGLLAAVILTVELPLNLLQNYIVYNVDSLDEVDALRLSMFLEGVFSPIYVGALIHALFAIKSGRSVTYGEAIAVGFKKWGPLFAARFQLGFLILGGFIAFIIPGIIVMVRYALLDEAVIVEGQGASGARARSAELTAGRRWPIFGAALLSFVLFLMLSIAVQLPSLVFDFWSEMPVAIALDCLIDIGFSVIQIVMFLFYWEATEDERSDEQHDAPSDDEPKAWDPRIAEEWRGTGDNPYRSPVSE